MHNRQYSFVVELQSFLFFVFRFEVGMHPGKDGSSRISNQCRHTEFREEIMGRKNLISEQMSQILARQSLSGKKCPNCGRGMPWNHPYRLCDNCFRRERQGRRGRSYS